MVSDDPPQKAWALEKQLTTFISDPKTPRALLWSIGKGHRLIDRITEKLKIKNTKDINIVLFDCDELELPRGSYYLNITQDSIAMGKQAIKLLNERLQKPKDVNDDASCNFKKILLPCLKAECIGIERKSIK